MDYTSSIAAAIASTKAAGEFLKAAVSLTADTKALTHINEAQHQVANVITALLDTQSDLFKLQIENRELRDQLGAHDDWEKVKAQYQMVGTEGGATVWKSIGDSPNHHYFCPTCFANKKIIPLQTTDGGYFFNCPACKGPEYKVKQRPPRPPPKVEF